MSPASTILIVDDCAEDRETYRRYLLKEPHQCYQILEADSAEEGLALCQENLYDLILLDFRLPDLDGLEFLEQLKQQEFETPPVIMLTGHGDEEVAVEAMKLGVQDYLVKKHLKPDVLQIVVRSAIATSRLQKQLSKTQERQRLIATTALRIRQSLNLEEIVNTAVGEVRQLLSCDCVAVYQFHSNKDSNTIANLSETEAILSLSPEQDLSADFIYHNITKYKENVACVLYRAGLNDCCLNLLDTSNTKGNLVAPIILNDNGKSNSKLWGLLIAHQCDCKRQWQQDEVEMLDELSVQLAIAIQQAELLAQTKTALAKEKKLNAFKSQIVATVSHEYRSPLATILAAAFTLKQHSDKLHETKQQKFLQLIEQKTKHMTKLVDEMLVVNQFELDKIKCKPQQMDLVQFFSEVIEEQRDTLGSDRQLNLRITGSVGENRCDRGLLRQILVNLLSNAVKYSPEGGKIEVHLIGGDSQVVFEVKDEGMGIPLKDQANLFQSFSRGSNVDTIPGTGLGLAIVKACVDSHGGEIFLKSQLGQGTTVKVTLPRETAISCQ